MITRQQFLAQHSGGNAMRRMLDMAEVPADANMSVVNVCGLGSPSDEVVQLPTHGWVVLWSEEQMVILRAGAVALSMFGDRGGYEITLPLKGRRYRIEPGSDELQEVTDYRLRLVSDNYGWVENARLDGVTMGEDLYEG